MGSFEELNAIGHTVVRALRRKKLSSGKTFMIYSNQLPKNQSYLEYPDLSIKVVTVGSNSRSFTIVRELTPEQATIVRENYNLH